VSSNPIHYLLDYSVDILPNLSRRKKKEMFIFDLQIVSFWAKKRLRELQIYALLLSKIGRRPTLACAALLAQAFGPNPGICPNKDRFSCTKMAHPGYFPHFKKIFIGIISGKPFGN
jgi:hypothetical protein